MLTLVSLFPFSEQRCMQTKCAHVHVLDVMAQQLTLSQRNKTSHRSKNNVEVALRKPTAS